MTASFLACGLMSGTSRDGIDVAFVEIAGKFPDNRVRLVHAETVRYPAWLGARLREDCRHFSGREVAALDFAVGEAFGRAAVKAAEHAGLSPRDVAVVGSHGQTLLHMPGGARLGAKAVRATLQVGNGAVIARLAGIPVVADFRSADIAVGGEGAPLVPVYDYVTLRSRERARVALNIGGIANLTAIPRGGRPDQMVCFDTGPGNCMLDVATRILTRGRRAFDRDGALARAGTMDRYRMKRLLEHPYYKRRPPKSTGWEEFGEDYTMRLLLKMVRGRRREAGMIMRTFTETVAESIAAAIGDFVAPVMCPDDVIVTGGGSKNDFLMTCLRRRLFKRFPMIVVERGEAFGIDSDAKEACAFAYLAYLHLKGVPGNLASQAAGLPPAILGALYPQKRN
ncbi:MAG: anhydro-N-acetylmuramic acid kinase [bacterium]